MSGSRAIQPCRAHHRSVRTGRYLGYPGAHPRTQTAKRDRADRYRREQTGCRRQSGRGRRSQGARRAHLPACLQRPDHRGAVDVSQAALRPAAR